MYTYPDKYTGVSIVAQIKIDMKEQLQRTKEEMSVNRNIVPKLG